MEADLRSRSTASTGRAIAAVRRSTAPADLELEGGVSAAGVPYLVGGWSNEARRELAMRAAQYSVSLVFAHRGSCEYIADVNVRVTDERGHEVAALDQAGPIVLLGLSPGDYQVTVTRSGPALARTITVGPQTRRQTVFYWSTGR